ncbi:S26 family signal peptidase [Streptomyces olivaceoviridis]
MTGPALLALGAVRAARAAVRLRRVLVSVTVRGTSMEPTYYDGDRVLVSRARAPVAGQVVVVERPDVGGGWPATPVPYGAGATALAGRAWMIKRVAAAPGDLVPREHVSALPPLPGGRVPPGGLLLLGDHPAASLDSRQLGLFPTARVLGVVLLRRRPGPSSVR